LRAPIEGAVLTAALGLSGTGDVIAAARTDYVLQCMGCHLADGRGMPPDVPALQDRIGYYLQVPEGREYVVQVPGAANARLTDAALAQVINWNSLAHRCRSGSCRTRRKRSQQHAARDRSTLCRLGRRSWNGYARGFRPHVSDRARFVDSAERSCQTLTPSGT
jgi:hypothetical protein